MRHVPASGANVRPVRRAFWICAAMPTVNASTRRLGRLTLTLSSPAVSATTRSIPLKSAVDSDVSAGDLRDRAQHVLPRAATGTLPRTDHLGDLGDDFLAVAHDGEVEEVGQRLGVVRAVSTGTDERVRRTSVTRPHGDSGEVDAV